MKRLFYILFILFPCFTFSQSTYIESDSIIVLRNTNHLEVNGDSILRFYLFTIPSRTFGSTTSNICVISFNYRNKNLYSISKYISKYELEVIFYITETKVDTPYSLSPIISEVEGMWTNNVSIHDTISKDTLLPIEFVSLDRRIDSISVFQHNKKQGIQYKYHNDIETIIFFCDNSKSKHIVDCHDYSNFKSNRCGIRPYYLNILMWQGIGIRVNSEEQPLLDCIMSETPEGIQSEMENNLWRIDWMINDYIIDDYLLKK